MEERIFHFALEHTLEMVLVFDKDGKIIYANHSAKEQLEFGKEISQKRMADIFPNEIQLSASVFAVSENMLENAKEMMAYRKNQTCFPIRAQFFKMQENPVMYLCTGYNLTDRFLLEKKAEQAAKEAELAQKVKTEFVANVTHELRTPVSGILGNTRELLETASDEKQLQKLRLIERACKNMNALINNILDFSKLEAGKFILEKRKFHFREMMEFVRANHVKPITEKGLEFSVTISPEIPEYIVGDELRIVQILNNLLSNAYKFTSVGKITVEVVKTAQMGDKIELFFLVIDTGIGIEKSNMDKLFQSFSQVDASISRKYGGTGLGLNISKQLVELMDGSIHVHSEPQKGTVFSFHIWVELTADEEVRFVQKTEKIIYPKSHTKEVFEEDRLREFGSKENKKELEKKMSKLILSLEMENWEKAEMFMESIRQLTDSAPETFRKAVLRLKIAVQKGDYEKAVKAYEVLEKELSDGNTNNFNSR